MRFTLPYPPSVNAYWRTFGGRMLLSRAGREYKAEAGRVARNQGAGKPLEGEVWVSLMVYRPRRIGDLDNTLKAVLDALRGVAYADDKQVLEIIARRRDDAQAPRVEVVVGAISTEEKAVYEAESAFVKGFRE